MTTLRAFLTRSEHRIADHATGAICGAIAIGAIGFIVASDVQERFTNAAATLVVEAKADADAKVKAAKADAAAKMAALQASFPRPGEQVITVTDEDPGGLLDDHIRFWERVRDSGVRVAIDGECVSACTVMLGIIPPERVCYTDKASWGFHQASMGGKIAPDVTKRMQRLYYPQVVNDWIAKHPLVEDVQFMYPTEMQGRYQKCSGTVPTSQTEAAK
jgi:hypothetical protein